MFDQFLREIIQHRMNGVNLKPRQPPLPDHQGIVAPDTSKPAKAQPQTEAFVSKSSARVKWIVAQMTSEEKLAYLGGIDRFCLRAIPRLGIPALWTSDATSGVRGVDAPVTTFPSAIALAASWNRANVRAVAQTIAWECRALGISILLAPGVNIARVPVCGRNFEYLGEDPYLAGELAAVYVQGAQGEGVLTTVKHVACNNSEYDRHKTDSVVDERTLREIYLPAFKRAVEAGTLGVMTSYNPVNGIYTSEHPHLVQNILRGEWGFDGLVMSDWDSLYSTLGPLVHGVDVEMPEAKWLKPDLILAALEKNGLAWDIVDAKLEHILYACERLGMLDRPMIDIASPIGTVAHKQLALSAAQEGIVLLKNQGNLLPFAVEGLRKVVVMGRNAQASPSGGGGSSYVLRNLPGKTLPEALRVRLASDAIITVLPKNWWASRTSREAVRHADGVIFVTGFDHVYESEAYDRRWSLPPGEIRGIKRAAGLNNRLAVVVHAGGALEMKSWIDVPTAILDAFYLGESSSEAIASVLVGEVNPSGRLPFSWAAALSDYESMRTYPKNFDSISIARVKGGQGDPTKRKIVPMRYEEGLMVGYRQFDTQGPEPLFPFGFGLSYTTFSYQDIKAEWADAATGEQRLQVNCLVRNSGTRSGSEVAQLYVHPLEAMVFRPQQELKGFDKVSLAPGESRQLDFYLTRESFARFDEGQNCWVVDPGKYELRVGSSSRQILQQVTVTIV